METNNTLDFIGTYIIPMITAAVGWLAGTRKRKNDFLQDLQASIDLLSSENKKLLADITSVNAEIVAVRKENEESENGKQTYRLLCKYKKRNEVCDW